VHPCFAVPLTLYDLGPLESLRQGFIGARNQGTIRADVKKARLVSDFQRCGWRAFALRAYRRDHVNVFPFLSRDDKMARVALPDQDTA
jgi:hypothetical protein